MGGLVAYNLGKIENSYSAGAGGPLVRENATLNNIPGTVTDSYWDSDTCLCTGGGTSSGDPKSTTAMQNENTFADWTGGVWEFPPGEYPQLRNNPRNL